MANDSPENTVFVGINPNHTLPLVEIKKTSGKSEVKSGILKDLGEAILKELKLKPIWVLLPKNRIAPSLLSGYVELICHINEVWHPKIKDSVFWSHELYQSTNLIVTIGKKPIRKIEDLYGKRVGTVTSFIYQDIGNAFEKKRIHREDGPSNHSNVQKLIRGHLDYILMSNLEFNYYKKIYPNLKSTDLKEAKIHVKCALSKKSKVTLTQLNQAIDTIKKNGTYAKIMKFYSDFH